MFVSFVNFACGALPFNLPSSSESKIVVVRYTSDNCEPGGHLIDCNRSSAVRKLNTFYLVQAIRQ
jgi:hypothetical protein